MSIYLRFTLLALLAGGILLACRTAELITNARRTITTPAALTREPTAVEPTEVALAASAATEEPTPGEIEAETEAAPPEPTEPPPPPTEPPEPTMPAPKAPTARPPATRKPAPTVEPSSAATPVPTRCPHKYCAVNRGCQTDSSNTVVEGVIYANGAPENGVAVRVAKQAGAYPLVDDFVSGTDPINPGKPDPNNPGRYILQIVAGAPREGNWWVFVVDRAGGTKQISDAVLIHTNDDPYNPVNCQHAFVDFTR